jgi:hypothetical protein
MLIYILTSLDGILPYQRHWNMISKKNSSFFNTLCATLSFNKVLIPRSNKFVNEALIHILISNIDQASIKSNIKAFKVNLYYITLGLIMGVSFLGLKYIQS